ncbi:MAG: GlsB/YeaQ/YmgE family stress response membrane protein [Bacteroidaceae bacterium]|nr:GlsB/YeaQ/YmgE family stress response membrane protein [Bacteroidaceae bacterium]
MGCLWSIIIGAVAGLLAGKIMRGGGFGFLWNTVLGIAGGWVGGLLLSLFKVKIEGGWIAELGVGLLGAIVILFVANLFSKKKK